MKLTLPMPPSANAMWRSIARMKRDGKPFVTVVTSEDGRRFQALASDVLDFNGPFDCLEGPVSLEAVVYFPDRRGDLDNRLKPILDVLQGVCFANDSQVTRIVLERAVDKGNPRVEITVEAA